MKYIFLVTKQHTYFTGYFIFTVHAKQVLTNTHSSAVLFKSNVPGTFWSVVPVTGAGIDLDLPTSLYAPPQVTANCIATVRVRTQCTRTRNSAGETTRDNRARRPKRNTLIWNSVRGNG